jgi:hypothetical protein
MATATQSAFKKRFGRPLSTPNNKTHFIRKASYLSTERQEALYGEAPATEWPNLPRPRRPTLKQQLDSELAALTRQEEIISRRKAEITHELAALPPA